MRNNYLKNFSVAGVEIGIEVAKALAEALKENVTLTRLDIDWDKLGDEEKATLSNDLKRNQRIAEFVKQNSEMGKDCYKKDDLIFAINCIIRKNEEVLKEGDKEAFEQSLKNLLGQNQNKERLADLLSNELPKFIAESVREFKFSEETKSLIVNSLEASPSAEISLRGDEMRLASSSSTSRSAEISPQISEQEVTSEETPKTSCVSRVVQMLKSFLKISSSRS